MSMSPLPSVEQAEKHRRAGHRAVKLELTERWAEAALAWRVVANQSPSPRWRMFARARVRYCLARVPEHLRWR